MAFGLEAGTRQSEVVCQLIPTRVGTEGFREKSGIGRDWNPGRWDPPRGMVLPILGRSRHVPQHLKLCRRGWARTKIGITAKKLCCDNG